MARFYIGELPLVVLLASVGGGAAFHAISTVNAEGAKGIPTSSVHVSRALQVRPSAVIDCNHGRRTRSGLAILQAGEDGGDDSLEDYKKQMAEFMARAHEKRLEAMEAVKVEVQKGYEAQIVDLRAKLAALPTASETSNTSAVSHESVMEPALAGATTGAAQSETVGSSANQAHPAYAARSSRPGWEERWGSEEAERASESKVTVADVSSMEARAAAVASSGAPVHPAYAARSQRPGWEARWGAEEIARTGLGTEGLAQMEAPAVSAPAYSSDSTVHAAYAARSQRLGWEARWGSEELARMAASTTSASSLSESDTQEQRSPLKLDVHPAYATRLERPGWENRWGSEERDRVSGAAAAVVAVEGAAAGYATAGGLDTPDQGGATISSSPLRESSGDFLAEDSVPNDITELKAMISSFRLHFQEYMMRAQEASSELRASKAGVEEELSRAIANLDEEQDLRTSLQDSFLGYMARSGAAGASTKERVDKLEAEVERLTIEAQELREFAQDYMVKAASEKQQAVEAVMASERAQAGERISALKAEVARLQAGV